MAIKLIVSDMDGTLLDRNDEILAETKAALKKCQQQAIKLILASGRSYSRLMPYAKELELEKYGGLLIEVNGMAIYDLKTNDRIIFKRLHRCDVEKLFPLVEELEIEFQVYRDKSVYYKIPDAQMPFKRKEREERNLPEDYPWTGGAWSWVTDSRKGYPDQKQFWTIDETPEEMNKFGCLGDPKQMETVFKIFMEKFGDQYEFTRTCPRLIEIAPKGITKGNALKQYMDMHHIMPEEVLVFGDGENDADMFSKVKYSIAMGNAEDYVKEIAFDVTDDNQHNGIANAIRKYVD